DCYNILGFIHDMYRPIPGRFKDYISTPKANMYQSLHTTVIGREGIPFEVQIRTRDMHHTAEYGIAAHWKYKSGVSRSSLEEKLAWVRQLLESQEVEDEDFVTSLKTDMFSDEVFVFTPNGDVVSLPAGSTPIDFAYSIHSAVGNRMTGAKVNGRMVQLDYKLANGEIVEIITSNAGRGPSRDWINVAKTSEARNKIKQWFKRECRDENIARGKSELELALKRDGITLPEDGAEDILLSVANRMSFHQIEEMYASLGYGGIKLSRVINRIKTEKEKLSPNIPDDETIVKDTISSPKATQTSNSGVIVPGVENCLVKFARCCTPIPGDSIIGFVTRGYGVSVHRADCQNVTNAMKSAEDLSRWISVFWAGDVKENFQTSLQLSAKDRSGLIMDIAAILNNLKLPVLALDARRLGDGYAVVNIVLNIKSKEQLEFVMNKLHGVQGIIDVKRSRL
ncbi:MAG: bifunctional (p)ppGpp synthetase/guanosine-3',5'-bis(diphosphate) 3'-pyrophosphohydrolase, partial [Oscillospiraceae bacterium]|nr:bifunctional (p)ppGpp synthetase/guanosine-3',5'-bis(diphosphate) 3'-pyrophosphohydrolase [Oscillospiraceae bacterium]